MWNKVCAMPWCHGVGYSRCKQAVFEPCFRTIVLTLEEDLQSKRALLLGDFQCVNQD